MKIHIVQKGDTLWKIAKKYGVNFEELKKMNSQLSNPDMIMPGMKVKVPTSGGMIKKEAPVGQKPAAVKKEMPIAEHPYAKEQPKQMPIVEAPIKEAPIIKEAPKAPFTPKMPVIPEIDINNYYMMNMASMTVQEASPPPQPQLPPKPVNILPEVKEVPKQEIPCPPPVVEQPVCEPECVPVTPIMPGPGFCPPMGYPAGPMMPYPDVAGTAIPMAPITPGISPAAVGGAYIQPHFEDESSSSIMPQMPMMNPGMAPGGSFGQMPGEGAVVQPPYIQPGVSPIGQVPAVYPQGGYQGYAAPQGYQPSGYQGYPASEAYPPGAYQGYQTGGYQGYPVQPYQTQIPPGAPAMGFQAGGYPGFPQGEYMPPMQQGPRNDYLNPGMGPVYGTQAAFIPYGQIPYGYPQGDFNAYGHVESSDHGPYTAGAQPYPPQGGQIPVTAGGDCGCGAPPAAPQQFVPSTPPVYMAPYNAPSQFAQPPFMNPYGMGPMGAAPYGMPRYDDESNENDG